MPVAHSGMVLETYIDWYRSVMVLLIYTFCRLVFGTLYPAYSSYKAVKTKNVKEYVRWMMYWIVFALFTFIETLTDAFLSWIPFYYEIKIVFVIWLLSPATRGSSILYRKFVHPQLMKRERDIDDCIATAKDKGCAALMTFGTRGLNYAANTVVQTALKGQFIFLQYIMSKPWQGQSVVADHLKKSYSMNDLSERSSNEEVFDETDMPPISGNATLPRAKTKPSDQLRAGKSNLSKTYKEANVKYLGVVLGILVVYPTFFVQIRIVFCLVVVCLFQSSISH
ncbi:receptor expression-enhancing protein 1-like isoform X9 [Lineus longissimus]|uniref:receptor expression-enhancing protein 1-like isoform X9 n=1 Tax=Lineus longissimus TaxID=88925 RepID=UPI00315D928C